MERAMLDVGSDTMCTQTSGQRLLTTISDTLGQNHIYGQDRALGQDTKDGKGQDRTEHDKSVRTIICQPPVVGRYVTIFIPGQRKILTLCEVEVYGSLVVGNFNLTGLRLHVGSNLPYEGQPIFDGSTFCDPAWTNADAKVSCIQLGYLEGKVLGHKSPIFGTATDAISVERRFRCSGLEGSLEACSQTVGHKKPCEIDNIASVICQPFIRLQGSSTPLQGRVEVLHGRIWSKICRRSWDTYQWNEKAARVACRELGFHDVASNNFSFGAPGSGRIGLRNLNCRGDERSLVLCQYKNWRNTSCGRDNNVHVKCSICTHGLLKDSNKFPDSAFRASAWRTPGYEPSSARLYSPVPWCLPDSHLDQNQFLDVSLPGIFYLSAVATVGGSSGYVTSYTLTFRVNKYPWKYATAGRQQIIPANTNNDTHNVIRRELDAFVYAQKVRFTPMTWVGIPCMRVELCGIEIPQCSPPNVTVVHTTSTSVKISWLPLLLPTTGEHDNYSVAIRDENSGFSYFNFTSQTSVDIANLLPYRRYVFQVKSAGLRECSGKAASFTFQTKPAAPSGPPKVLFVQDIQSTSVILSWSAPAPNERNGVIAGYQLCYSTNISSDDCQGYVRNVSGKASFKVEDLQPITVYYFKIRATTIAGVGPYTTQMGVITGSDKNESKVAYVVGVIVLGTLVFSMLLIATYFARKTHILKRPSVENQEQRVHLNDISRDSELCRQPANSLVRDRSAAVSYVSSEESALYTSLEKRPGEEEDLYTHLMKTEMNV